MFDPETASPALPDEFGKVRALIDLILNAKACQSQLDALTAVTVKANEAKAAAARQEASLAAREAAQNAAFAAREDELSARQAKISGREDELIAWQGGLTAKKERLLEIQREISTEGDRFKLELMRYAGVADHFDARLQTMPDWNQLARDVLGLPDPRYGDQSRHGDASAETITESLPGAVHGVSLTRTREMTVSERRSMRRADQRHAEK